MPRYGEIAGISYNMVRWSIYELSYHYRLFGDYGMKDVYVTTMAELRKEIAKHSSGQNEKN